MADIKNFHPTEKTQRLVEIDALRGLALLGILIANIPYVTNVEVIYQSGRHTIGSPDSDTLVNFLFHLLIDKKFISIFSMLFGFGFYLQMKKAQDSRVAFRPYFFKRMLVLLAIGCVHAYVFWFGDIIRDYAICGMFLLLVYNMSPKKLLITGIIFSFFTGLVFILNGAVLPPYPYDTALISELPQTASYQRYLQINFTIDPFKNFIYDSPLTLVFAFGNMLVGFWMGKTGFFQQPGKFRKAMKWLMIGGLIIGTSASYLFYLITNGTLELTPALLWLPFFIAAGMQLQSLAYISAFVLLFQNGGMRRILSAFSPVGKVALSNYLLQTVFYLVFFFHWTHLFKLYGRLTQTETYIACLLLFILQVLISRWWIGRHEQGPVEQVWKKISYRFAGKENSASRV